MSRKVNQSSEGREQYKILLTGIWVNSTSYGNSWDLFHKIRVKTDEVNIWGETAAIKSATWVLIG